MTTRSSETASIVPGLRSAALALVFGCGASAFAAVPVVESQASGDRAPAQRAPVTTAQPAAPQAGVAAEVGSAESGASSGASLARLYYQLQTMQEEIRQLRGQLEEQQFTIDRLRRDQQEQYLDLDGRVADLARRGSVAAPSQPGAARENTDAIAAQTGALPPAQQATREPASAPTSTEPPRTSASGGEQSAYNGAITLMRDKRFDESVDSFNQLVVDYPNGALTPNAFYWLGELYLAKNELEQSRQSFMQVLNLYPDHRKVPDSLYKLGVVYSMQGDSRRSLEYLKRVQESYPDSSAAGLAGTFAAELQ